MSLTHRIAKLASVEEFLPEYAQDHAIDPYNISMLPADNPLKASDGVLLRSNQETLLWKSNDMPREIQAHGALNSSTDSLDGKVEIEGRGLYQMTAMAPLVWRGIASIPEDMAGYVCGEWQAAFGKHRGTMGGGRLTVERISFQEYMNGHTDSSQIFIAQSPILLPRGATGNIAETFAAMIENWCGEHSLPPMEIGENGPLLWISAGICFGWNRHRGGYAGAEKVIQPGSVFRLKSPPDGDTLETAFLKGLGPGRDKGFGALAVHPGKAGALLNRKTTALRKKKSGNSLVSAVKTILPLRKKHLPSISQLYALKNRLETGGTESAVEYLRKQDGRNAHISAAWRDAKDPLKQILESTDPETAGTAIKMLADFAGKQEGEKR
ncbi:MAG: hypothetical protein GY737_30030 [Desulfobacteraceae bacterium]|nr:hypothetical protein [Desulfobacteraceae bacterium]